VDNDRRRKALRVRFTADGEADASEGGGGGGGGEAGGESMIFYTITYNNIQNRVNQKRISHKFFFGRQKYNIINKT